MRGTETVTSNRESWRQRDSEKATEKASERARVTDKKETEKQTEKLRERESYWERRTRQRRARDYDNKCHSLRSEWGHDRSADDGRQRHVLVNLDVVPRREAVLLNQSVLAHRTHEVHSRSIA